VALLGLLLVGGVAAGVFWLRGGLLGREPFNGPTFTVKRDKLRVTIVERGSLEAAENKDVICQVRAGTKNATVSTTVKWVKDNGDHVKKGEVVVYLDDSGLQEAFKDQKIKVDGAKADLVKAEEQYRIDEIGTQTDIEKAKNDRDLAKIDLEKYVKGDFIQAVKDVEGRIETARSDYENWKDRSSWSARMVKKGLMGKSQADADESRMDGARIALEKVDEEKRVLVEYTKAYNVQDKTTKLAQAERGLQKTMIQARATLSLDDAARKSKKFVFDQESARMADIEDQIGKCTLKAPQDGVVVYYMPEQTRGGIGSQQSIVAAGEPVHEGQKLLQIPDMRQMQVNVRVHEAMVSRLHNAAAHDPDTWQHAEVRIDAFPSTVLHGHVRTVDNQPSQTDWFSSDVKVYKTIVTLDESMEGLKPGMSAEVTITADESREPVLLVPVQSVVGAISMGAERYCFVVGPDGRTEMRDIVCGMSNERVVEVKSGLKEGEKVALNPRPLLPEGSELRPGKVHAKDEAGSSEGGEKKQWKKGEGGPKGPGAAPGAGKGPAAGGPGGGPGAAPGGAAPDAAAAQRAQQFMTEMRSLTPEQRRDRLNQIPAEYRSKARQALQGAGMQVAN
jgi:RND family efflux transporter MFP subunit